MGSPDRPTNFAEPYREAHLESISPRSAPSTVSVSALERVGAHLAADENFGRKLTKDAARALNGVDYLTEREKRLLAGMDTRAWAALVEASDKFKVAVGKKGLAGVPSGSSPLGDYLNGFKFGGAGSAYGWGDVKTPNGPGIAVGNGTTVGGHVGGGATGGSAPGGSDDGGRNGGSGHFGNYGGYTGHGNAGDPRSPFGVGARSGGAGDRGSPFQGTADRYTGISMHGDPYGGGGISGGNLPARAELAGSAWKALHPGRDISDDKKPGEPTPTPTPTPTPDGGTDGGGGGRTQPMRRTDGTEMLPSVVQNPAHAVTAGEFVTGGLVGLGGAALGVGVGVLLENPFLVVALGLAGGIGGAYGGYRIAHHFGWMPADTDLTGGGGGTGGPAGPRARAQQLGQYYMPADDTTGTSPTGPRSQVLRSLRSSGFYFPSEDATGGPPGPRSRSGPEGSLYMPAPDDPRPGNPHSRELAVAGIIPY